MTTTLNVDDNIVLVADANADRRERIRSKIKDLPVPILFAQDGEEALRKSRNYPLVMAVLSQDLMQTSGTKLSRLIRKNRDCEIILYGDPDNPIEPGDVVGEQIDDYLPVLSDPTELRLLILRHLRRRELAAENKIIGRSPRMMEVIDLIAQIAPTNSSVLLTGESGTGKELVARTIHRLSLRRDEAFVAVNCGALPETLLESELFGHEKGSFTGASARRVGHFELANRGTILLDEIGEMSLSTQVKLLRVLEEREFMRVGGQQTIKVDVRVIAATNRDLLSAINVGQFRQDLYYRLKVVTVHLPPLRQRREDISLLIGRFVDEMKEEHNTSFGGFTPATMQILEQFDWPGNIRELRNFVESMVVLYPHKEVQPHDLPAQFTQTTAENLLPVHGGRSREDIEREIIYKSLISLRDDIHELRGMVEQMWKWLHQSPALFQQEVSVVESGRTIEDVEEEMIRQTLREKNGNRRDTARQLGISERTLYRKMEKYGIR